MHLLRINSGGRLSHNHAGYVTKDGRSGNEFEPSEGPGQGTGSSHGATGAGYAGTGGRGSGVTRVGQFYGDYRKPFDYGSAGGYGLHYGTLEEPLTDELFTRLSRIVSIFVSAFVYHGKRQETQSVWGCCFLWLLYFPHFRAVLKPKTKHWNDYACFGDVKNLKKKPRNSFRLVVA